MNKLIRLLFLFSAIVFFGFKSGVNAQLAAGDIMFVGFNADGTDGFAFVALVAIPASTTIYFTDNNWNGSLFSTTEGTITWNSGASIIAAGNVIILNGTGSASFTVNFGSGTMVNTINLNVTADPLYAFLGTSSIAPTTFLSAISNGGFTGANTLTGTGLTAGVNATSILGGPDIMVYSGSPACNVSVSACAALIANPANWALDDGTGNQDNNGIFPDFPTDVPAPPNVSVLPIGLIYFSAQITSNGDIELKWATAFEVNNDYFLIESSIDGENWSNLIKINGVGNSTALMTYSTIDDRFLRENRYYRLTQTDFDGQKETFNIISVNGEENNRYTLRVFPNPTTGILEIIGKKFVEIQPIVFDYQGRNVSSSVEKIKIDDNYQRLNFSGLTAGIYLLQFGNETRRVELLYQP